MPYFDLGNTTCTNMLPADIRCRTDIGFLASGAEADILQHYTRQAPDVRGTALDDARGVDTGYENLSATTTDPVVYLRYYKADPTDLTTADELSFLAAMRRSIAALIRLRAAQEDVSLTVRSETRGRRSVSYWEQANPLSGDVPRSVTKWLKPYDRRPVTFAI